MLSDPKKRKWFDQYGEHILKEGLTVNSNPIGGYRFIGDTSELLVKFFGTSNILSKSLEIAPQPVQEHAHPKDITIDVRCTLEELYCGCRKTIEYSSASGTQWKTIEIPPGCESSYKFIFYGEGEESSAYPRSNLIFLIKEISHKYYRRDGKNLIYKARISLLQALSGESIEIVIHM